SYAAPSDFAAASADEPMCCQSAVPQLAGRAMLIVTHDGVTVTLITCWPYDPSRKKFATLSALLVITCCACAVVNAGAMVLLKFAMITSTLFTVAALAIVDGASRLLAGSA